MQQLFIPQPSTHAKDALRELGCICVPFTDAGTDGVLITTPNPDIENLSECLHALTELRLVPDTTPPEFSGMIRVLALAKEDLNAYGIQIAANNLLQSLDRRAPSPQEDVQTLRTHLTHASRNLSLLVQQRDEGFDPQADLKDRIVKEVEAILKHDKVASLSVAAISPHFTVLTTALTCKHPRKEILYSFGQFEITFDMTPQKSRAVKWKGLAIPILFQGRKLSTPHIERGGSACLGNFEGVCEKLLAAGEYFAAVDMAIKFAESVNPDKLHTEILERFPLVSQL